MAAGDARPVPRRNIAFRVTFPIMDATGALVSGATGLDSEVSKDGGTFADCTNEATEIATSSGMYYLDLTATEMDADTVSVIVKSAGKTVPIVMYPESAGDFRADVTHWGGTALPVSEVSGPYVIRLATAQGGAAQAITLDASANGTDDFYNGCRVEIVDGTGPFQARIITDYVGSTRVATVDRAWSTTPTSSSVFRLIAGSLPQTTDEVAATSADKLLGRTITGGADGGRTVESALAVLRNKVVIDRGSGAITVYDTDDSTVLWSGTVTVATGGSPIGTVDPS